MKTKFKRIGRQSVSVILAVMMMLSTMLVGMVTSNADNTVTVYFTPESDWITNSYEIKAHYQYKYDNDNDVNNYWEYSVAEDTGKTISSNKVYKASIKTRYGGLKVLQFQAFQDSNLIDQIEPFNHQKSTGWTGESTFSNKYWNGSSWVDPVWDAETTTHKVTIKYDATHVDSISLGGNSVTSSGHQVEVENNSTPTLTVTTNAGYRITSVTQDGTALTESNGTYTLNAVTAATTITVNTESTSTPTGNSVVYFANPVNDGWSNVYAYMWKHNTDTKNHEWPGEEQTKICQEDYVYNTKTYKVYKVIIPSDYNRVIFNNNSVQTGDIEFTSGNLYIYTSNKAQPTKVSDYSEPATDYTLTWTAPNANVSSATISNSGTVTAGTEVTVTVNVNNGYEATLVISDVDVTKSVSGNEYTFKFKMPANDIIVAPAVSAKGVAQPVVSIGPAVGTGTTLNTYVNKSESIKATVVPADASYTEVDTDNSDFVQLTYNGEVVEISNYIDASANSFDQTKAFKFDKVGTYLLTYNGYVKSKIDNTKTASASATLTINVTYSATQQAYVDLKALVDDTTTYPESVTEDQYLSGVTEYNDARTAAANAVANGLPVYDAEDTYTALNTALVTAKNNLVANKAFYIGGNFAADNINNNGKDESWQAHPDNIKFIEADKNLYYVETKKNIRNNIGNYFFIYTKSGSNYIDYGAAADTKFDSATNLKKSITITNTGYNGHKLYLNDPTSADNAVIWLDTSSYKEDGTGSMKIFYTSGMPTADYAVSGGLANGDWNNYQEAFAVNEPTNNPFVFKRQITVNSDKYFRIISKNKTQYAPKNDQDQITGAKYTTVNKKYDAFKITAGSYYLYLDQSGETPVIWVESADYNVSAKGQYTFDGSTYNDYTSNPPTITIDHTTVTAGASVEVTATNDVPGYKFIGWASTNGTFADASALSTTFTPNADGAVAVARYAKQLTATVKKADESNNGSWTDVSGSYTAGDTVTITFTPAETDYVSEVTVNGESKLTSLADNTLTFIAGVTDENDSNIDIVVTFSKKPKYSYSHDYATGSNDTMGTYTSSPVSGSYDYNTEITLIATPKSGYKFVGWYDNINGTGVALSTNAEYQFNLTANTEVYAKFAENTGAPISGLYLIYSTNNNNPQSYTNYLNLYKDSSDQVYAYFDAETFDADMTYYFMISTSTGENSYQKAYMNDSNHAYTSEANKQYITATYQHYGLNGKNYYAGKFSVTDAGKDVVASVKINLGYYDGKKDIVESSTDSTKAYTYEVIPTTSGAVVSKIKIYAKDGTLRTNYQKYADMADTVLSADDGVLTKHSHATYYEEAYASVGSTITVKTTIKEDYKNQYYVKAFCINGISYGIIDSSKANKDTGVYTCTYTIPEDCTDKFIEITPIYYYINDENAVTFYVEGFEENVQKVWGNTIAVQAWYNNGTDTNEEGKNKNALGGYPGQPLVYEGGKYSMQIPKYLNNVTANYVKGITLNNYIWDDIHVKNFNNQQNDNAQTYDYDDFYKLANKKDVDNIIFDFRYRTKTDNDPSQSGLSSSTYNKEELEPLTDYYGNIVDLFGNELSESWKTDFDSTYLTVISNGYKGNYIGKYATEWSVYDHDGKYITTINCSQLLDEATVNSAYTTAYNTLKSYAKLPVKIAYEKSIFSGNDKGNRADGRWYYSTKAQKITSNVIIQYKPNDASSFIQDEFSADSNVGSVTGTKAYFTNADYYGKTSCDGEVDGGKFSVRAETDSEAKYYFIGWYLKTSDGYAFMSNDPNYDIPMTNNETYVARFIPTPSGTLTLSHTILPNSDSAIGRTYIKADIVSKDGKTVYSIPETSGNLVVPSKYVTYTSTNKIKVTLRTVPYGNDTVEGFYNYDKDQYSAGADVVIDSENNACEVTRAISSLFKETEDGGNVSYSLERDIIPFYSKIKSVTQEYKITYTYKTRTGENQSYVIKDTVSGIELEEMWAANEAENKANGTSNGNKYQLSKAFITKKAPFVSNFREEIRWNMDEATISDYTATVSANTSTVDLEISALTVAGQWTQPATVKYGELAMSNGDYLYKTDTTEFPVTFNGYDFSFWAIFDNKDEAEKYSNAVKAYMSGTPDANMSQRLTDLTTGCDGYKNLISKSYSKEYNYVSYQNYYIVPVYAGRFAKDQIKESQASIRLLEYTRNQWTNENGVKGDGTLNTGGTKTDYLYTDFALSFDKNQILIKDNPNIKIGIAFEIVDQYDTEKGSDLTKYVTDSNADDIKNLIKLDKDNGKVGITSTDKRSVYRYEINNSTISVKNRIEYYLRFSNTQKAQQNVMKVYSYIYDKKANDGTGEVYLSDPVYMNLYDIGNLTYITSDLASIDLGPAQ